MPKVDFFYFFGSVYSYLSVLRIDRLAADAGVRVNWRPFSLRTLMVESGYSLKAQPKKMDYIWRDIERRAGFHGLPFETPPIWPTDPDELANRVGIVAAREGWCREYTQASFRAWFLKRHHLGSMDSLNKILTSLGREPASVIELANSPDIRKEYDGETEAARKLGIFGAPTFVAGHEIFWGDDRLEEAIAWSAGQHPIQSGQVRNREASP